MRKVWWGQTLVLLVLFTAAPLVRGEDDARAIIEKAVKARGDADKNAAGYQGKFKGTIELAGMKVPFNSEMLIRSDGTQSKETTRLTLMGQQITQVQVFDGKKGWVNALGQTQELQGNQLEDMKDGSYENTVSLLWPLLKKDSKYKLSPLSEVPVEGKPAVGVKVSHEGHRDINLYFDKTSFMLVKTESRVTHPVTQQKTQAVGILSDYKDVGGFKWPGKMVVTLDGQKFMEAEFVEVKMMDKLDDSQFAKP